MVATTFCILWQTMKQNQLHLPNQYREISATHFLLLVLLQQQRESHEPAKAAS
jgi:hypothetical protein